MSIEKKQMLINNKGHKILPMAPNMTCLHTGQGFGDSMHQLCLRADIIGQWGVQMGSFLMSWFWARLWQCCLWLRVLKTECSWKKDWEVNKKIHPLDYFSPIKRTEFETCNNLKR